MDQPRIHTANLDAVRRGKALLAKISASEISEKIRAFRRLELRDLDEEGLAREISNVISVTVGIDRTEAFMNVHGLTYPVGTNFYRARRAADSNVPPLCGLKRRDADAPDGPLVKRPGRLHKVGESLLYTAVGDPHTTLSELRLPIDHYAVIFAYRAKRAILAPVIGPVEKGFYFEPDEREKLNIINDFLHDEFTREVGEGTEHLYRISEIIAKWYFDGPPHLQDCWIYSSTKNRNLFNAAFRPFKAMECIDLFGSMFVQRTSERSFRTLAVGKPDRKKFTYFPMGSREQKELFPNLHD